MDFSQAGPAGGRRVARVEQKAVDVGGMHSQVGQIGANWIYSAPLSTQRCDGG
eukprot:COSAG06_NODE_692_length_13043_cov_369.439509_2_plen_53_part_00